MSEVRLVVREAECDWSGTIHGSCADRAIAALGADPTTLAELETACGRFAKPEPDHRFLANLRRGLDEEPYDAGVVIIDLAARLVLVDSTYSSPGMEGDVDYHDGQSATDIWLRYHLADDWRLMSDPLSWRAVADARREKHFARPDLDARRVFYGRPLLEFIARETFEAFARQSSTNGRTQKPDPETTYQTIKEIHAAWLLTPREDLAGRCPREVALEHRDHLTWDLQDQCERWSKLGFRPPGLDMSSFAYRYAGFGTHELVEYYDLVRELLGACWNRLTELHERQPAADGLELVTAEDFLAGEVPRLEMVRDEWFDAPDWNCHGRTPRSIIDRERARLPEAVSGREAMIDPDCPCCQMLADLPGPMFWHLDGSEMDEDFAFDLYHPTREEWEAEQRKWEENYRRFKAEQAERERLGLKDSGEDSIWSSSFSAEDDADMPLGVRLFGIGCLLAELIGDLRIAPGDSAEPPVQGMIDRLNRDFGNLREILQTSEPSLADALIVPVRDCFADSLAAVALDRPDLSAKCESLTNRLAGFLDPASTESPGDADDLGFPF